MPLFPLLLCAPCRFALEDKAKRTVTIEADCPPPSARVSASFVPYIAPVSAQSSCLL